MLSSESDRFWDRCLYIGLTAELLVGAAILSYLSSVEDKEHKRLVREVRTDFNWTGRVVEVYVQKCGSSDHPQWHNFAVVENDKGKRFKVSLDNKQLAARGDVYRLKVDRTSVKFGERLK